MQQVFPGSHASLGPGYRLAEYTIHHALSYSQLPFNHHGQTCGGGGPPSNLPNAEEGSGVYLAIWTIL